tara:strand:- start:1617 stop:4121 length:2505 start_codon:yes stop_codon:yes gene_type:complete
MAEPTEDLSKLTPEDRAAYDVGGWDAVSTEGLQAVANTVAKDPTEDLTIMQSIGESFSGSRRRTDETDATPSYTQLPEFSKIANTWPTIKTTFGTAMGAPEEMAKVITKQFPEIKSRTDEKGNSFLTSAIDGGEYVIKPGFEAGDIGRAGVTAGIFALTKGRGMVGTALQAGGTQTVYEALQKKLGGDFGTAEVAFATVLGPAGNYLSKLAKTGYSRIANVLSRTPASRVPSVPLITDAEIVEIARKASQGNLTAIADLATIVAPDDDVVAAAKNLGIEDYLQPDHITTSQVFRELSQVIKSTTPSALKDEEQQLLTQVGEEAVRLIDDLGGTTDMGQLGHGVRVRMQTTLDRLGARENKLWELVRQKIGATTEVSPNNTLAYLENRIVEIGGDVANLTPIEKMLYEKLSPKPIFGKVGGSRIQIGSKNPTYSLFDAQRRQVGRILSTPHIFPTEDIGLAKTLYSVLSADAEVTAAAQGAADAFSSARLTTKMIKSVEDDLIALFGKAGAENIDQVGLLNNLTKSVVGQTQKGNPDAFARMIEATPKALRNRVAVSAISHAFGKATKNGELNFNTYKNWFDAVLKNSHTSAVLRRTLSDDAFNSLHDLYLVSKSVQRSLDEAVRTGRPIEKGLDVADSIVGRLYTVGQKAALGIAVETVSTAIGVPPSWGILSGVAAAIGSGAKIKDGTRAALNGILGSPEFRDLVAKAGTANQQAALRALTRTSFFREYLSSVGLPRTTGEKFFQGIIQAGGANTNFDAMPIETVPDAPAVPIQRSPAPVTPARGVQIGEPQEPGAQPGAIEQPLPQAPAAPPQANSREMLERLFPNDRSFQV